MSENAIVDMGATVSCEPDDRNAVDGSVRKSSGQSVLVADGKSAAITARFRHKAGGEAQLVPSFHNRLYSPNKQILDGDIMIVAGNKCTLAGNSQLQNEVERVTNLNAAKFIAKAGVDIHLLEPLILFNWLYPSV